MSFKTLKASPFFPADAHPHKISHLLPLPVFYSPSSKIVLIYLPLFTSKKKILQCKSALQSDLHPKVWLISKAKLNKWQIRDALEKEPRTRGYFYALKIEPSFFDQRTIQLCNGYRYTTHPLTINLAKAHFVDSAWLGLEGDFAYRIRYSPPFAEAIQSKKESPPVLLLQRLQSKSTYKQLVSRYYKWLLHKLDG
jgi:hypothetical protein